MDQIYIVLQDLIGNISIVKAIMISVCLILLMLTIVSLVWNFFNWIINVYTYSKLGWYQLSYPDYDEKILSIKYAIYVVGFPSGEIFYVDNKRLKRLKRKKLVNWSNEVSCYVFSDDNVDDVRKLTSPNIHLRYEPCRI